MSVTGHIIGNWNLSGEVNETGEGANVVPNPPEEATETLEKIGIDDVVYSITGEQEQADWDQADPTAVDYIKNKPTIPAAQVNSDWDAASGVAQILNKPNLSTVATTGSYTDLTDKPTIPAAQVNSDWNAVSGVAEILNKPPIPSIEANPIGTGTDDLTKIEIDGTIYDIPSGGGNVNFITKTSAEYAALPLADKTDPTKLYFIDDGTEQGTDVDPTNYNNFYESSMNISITNGKLTYTWNGSTDIGANSVYTIAIPSSVNKIKFKITTGSSYYNSYGQLERFKVFVGVRPTYTTGFINVPDISDWLALKNFSTSNDIWEDELDLSNVNVNTYLYVAGHGWNMVVDYMQTVTTGDPHTNYIYYKNIRYDDTTADNVSYDNTGTGIVATDVQDAITELKSNLTQNTINVFTNSASKITKENGRCTLIFGYSDSVPNLLGATLPEGYRPSESLSNIVLVYSNSTNRIYLGYVTLTTAGTFTFYYSGSYGQARESISGSDWRIIGELVYYTN